MKPLYGQVCDWSCGKFQIEKDYKCVCDPRLREGKDECVPPEGETWANLVDVCADYDMAVNLDGLSCVPE